MRYIVKHDTFESSMILVKPQDHIYYFLKIEYLKVKRQVRQKKMIEAKKPRKSINGKYEGFTLKKTFC